MTKINILTKPDTGNVNPINYKSYWNSVYYEESGLAEWNVDIRPALYSLYVAVVRESSGGLTLSEVEVYGYGELDHILYTDNIFIFSILYNEYKQQP